MKYYKNLKHYQKENSIGSENLKDNLKPKPQKKSLFHYLLLAATPLEASSGTLNISTMSMLR